MEFPIIVGDFIAVPAQNYEDTENGSTSWFPCVFLSSTYYADVEPIAGKKRYLYLGGG